MTETAAPPTATAPATGASGLRIFAWTMVFSTFAFFLNAFLTYWMGLPGADAALSGDPLGIGQALLYPAALGLAVLAVMRGAGRDLRTDAEIMARMVRFIIRFAFWTVLLVGTADIAVSFMRVEGLLEGVVGAERAADWGFNKNRAPDLHLPLIGVALVLAFFTRTMGFHWLAVMVVLAELSIVITRFIFSYEQAFQADLVRFWYGSLFLFASAQTLVEDGHVRVDVFYAGMTRRSQGIVNVIGCLFMGILFCWVILYFGMATRSSIIVAPLLSLEITQAGFGMYVKYMMAGFLAIFGLTMQIQFCSYLLESWADWRGDPGGRPHDDDPTHHMTGA